MNEEVVLRLKGTASTPLEETGKIRNTFGLKRREDWKLVT
jgi:hypothetical protein